MTEQEAIGKIFVAKVDRPVCIGIKKGEKVTYLGDDKVSTRVGDRSASPWSEYQSTLWLLCPNSNKIAVKCSTVEEKNRVIEFSRGKGKGYVTDSGIIGNCINLKDGCHCDESYYRNENFIIIPYSQFVRDYLSIGNSLADFGSKVVSDEKESREISEKSTSSNTLSELPEKWNIFIDTEDKKRIVGRWLDATMNRDNDGFYEFKTSLNSYVSNSYGFGKNPDSVSITFDQFKKWVLKEETKEERKPYSFTPKAGDVVKYVGTRLSTNVKSHEMTVTEVDGFRVYVSPHDSDWINMGWFVGGAQYSEPQFILISEKKEDQYEDCEDCNGTGTTIEGKLYPSGHTEVTVDCPTCKGEGSKIPGNPLTQDSKPVPLTQKLSQPTETWEPQVGDWVMIDEEELPITESWLGEGGRVKHQGPFKVESKAGRLVNRMSGVKVMLSPLRFRKALPHEILTTEEKTMTKKESNIWAEIVSTPSVASISSSPKVEVPEYVECVKSWHRTWTTGKIYKTEVIQKDFPDRLTLKNDEGKECNVVNWQNRPEGFKPSTREAYEKQENIISVGLGDWDMDTVGGKAGTLKLPDYSVTKSTMSIEQIYGIKFAEPTDILSVNGNTINFKKFSPETQPSNSADVKLPKALVMEADQENFNLITL